MATYVSWRWIGFLLGLVLIGQTVASPVNHDQEEDVILKLLKEMLNDLQRDDENSSNPSSSEQSAGADETVDCDFGSGFCGWTNEQDDDRLEWSASVSVAAPEAFKLGDSNGDKPGSMLYMFVADSGEGIDDPSLGNRGRLRSPAIEANEDGQCFRFSYHLLAGSLRILLTADGETEQLLWSRSTNQGDRWFEGQVIIATSGTYRIVVEGAVTYLWGLQVAVDDFRLEASPCSVPVAPQCGVSEVQGQGKTAESDWVKAFLASLSGRINGGFVSDKGQWPWIVRLNIPVSGTQQMNCGGTLIHPQWVLTASHCFESWVTDPETGKETFDRYYKENVRLMFGEWHVKEDSYEEGSFKLQSSDIFIHEKRGTETGVASFDIALVKLPQPVELTDKVNIACMQALGETMAEGTNCYVSGWGGVGDPTGTQSHYLKHYPVVVLSNNECDQFYHTVDINDDQICVISPVNPLWSACRGDSGGPLACELDGRYYLAGAASFVIDCTSGQASPAAFARVSYFNSWIENTIAENSRK